MYRFRHFAEYLFVAVCILGLLFTGYIVASSEASVFSGGQPQCSQSGYPGYPPPQAEGCVFLPYVKGGDATPTPTSTPTPTATPSPTPTVTPNPYP